jgi:hypothetical protein
MPLNPRSISARLRQCICDCYSLTSLNSLWKMLPPYSATPATKSRGLTDDQEDTPTVRGSRGGANWSSGPTRRGA